MGLFTSRDKRIADLAAQAAQAAADGRRVFTPALRFRATNPGGAEHVDPFADAVEAIESAGWQLAHWSVSVGSHDAPCAYPVFRR